MKKNDIIDNKTIFLVGSTGYVGKNLALEYDFSETFHSTDICNAYGKNPDILIYAGVTGTKFLANSYPDKDYEIIKKAEYNIEQINPKKIILISSIDVYDKFCIDENYIPTESIFGAYGNHRLHLENYIKENYNNYHIIRLPAIYGIGIKKNFVYDLIHVVPSILDVNKYEIIKKDFKELDRFYHLNEDGMYKLNNISTTEMTYLKKFFINYKFNAFYYTDSRSSYQYYNLKWLWDDIVKIINNDIKIINIVTEPIASDELFQGIYKKKMKNELDAKPIQYNIKTEYDSLWGQNNGYLYEKEKIMSDLTNYIYENVNNI